MTTRADTTKVREALQAAVDAYNQSQDDCQFGRLFTDHAIDKCNAALAALDSAAQEGEGPVAWRWETERRRAAVGELISLGWKWDGSAWQKPSPSGPVAKGVDLCEVARELERVAAEKAIRGASWAVINMAPPFRMAYWSACEEIAERIGVPYTDPDIPDAAAPVPSAHDAEGKVTGDPDDAEPANSIEFGLTRDNAGLGEREAWWMRKARIWRERAIALGWHEVRDTELPPPPSTNKGQT